jgi:RHS repeat-associated protein
MGYSYDAADRLTRITYTNGSGELGRIDYGNDAAGRRQETSGSWARMNLPAAMPSGTFDAANRLTARGTTTYSYDDTGSLTSDGAQAYAWNARGELTGLSGASPTASFSYDAFGRRRQATIGTTTTSYRYDGDNAIVETQGSSAVRVLAGIGIDSTFTRTDGAGTEALLADALGSTVALSDGSGAVQTEYSYDPYGTPTASGASSANPTQFTGREWDGTGLQYSRARYYSPAMGRFMSEDPLGFAGGDVNLYSYVGNAPLHATDPFGLSRFGDWWTNHVAMPVMDVLVDTVHPIAYDYLPGYGLGYALGRRKDPREVAAQAASAFPIGRILRGPARVLAPIVDKRPIERIYEPNPKHGAKPRRDARGRPVSRAPRGDCQAMLDCSVQPNPNSPERRGVEPETGETVIFRRHLRQPFPDKIVERYHGYVPLG